ncbi:MAG: 4Fe-4S dicluster domain-containing protein [Methanomassiliicoccaceae archaeon]|jgi:heterodisulfide reductase subunit C|nr:4Fe-4S dicluster domain-containing protein [Methanomassiliicoccaceae archaeon]
MVRSAGDIVSSYSLSSCVGCGKCDKVCPSSRNGGIRPDHLIAAILAADPSSELQELQADVWKCLMCHRCSTICPKKIDVTGTIRTLRYDSLSSGETPKRFRMASDTLMEIGRAFPVNELVNRKRGELGLDPISYDESSVNELKMIIARTGFRHE